MIALQLMKTMLLQFQNMHLNVIETIIQDKYYIKIFRLTIFQSSVNTLKHHCLFFHAQYIELKKKGESLDFLIVIPM